MNHKIPPQYVADLDITSDSRELQLKESFSSRSTTNADSIAEAIKTRAKIDFDYIEFKNSYKDLLKLYGIDKNPDYINTNAVQEKEDVMLYLYFATVSDRAHARSGKEINDISNIPANEIQEVVDTPKATSIARDNDFSDIGISRPNKQAQNVILIENESGTSHYAFTYINDEEYKESIKSGLDKYSDTYTVIRKGYFDCLFELLDCESIVSNINNIYVNGDYPVFISSDSVDITAAIAPITQKMDTLYDKKDANNIYHLAGL